MMASPFSLKLGRHSFLGTNGSQSSQFDTLPTLAKVKEQSQKSGLLKKLSGRGFLSSGKWRDRYCILVKSGVYFFRNEEPNNKPTSYINLEQYGSCTEASTRFGKKVANVFGIAASDPGFFDCSSGIYLAAETPEAMKQWMTAINEAISRKRAEQSRKDDGKGDSLSDKTGSLPRSEGRLNVEMAKGRPRGPEGRRLPQKPRQARNRSPNARSVVKVDVERRDETTDDELLDDREGSLDIEDRNSQGNGIKGQDREDTDSHRSSGSRTASRISARVTTHSPAKWSDTRRSRFSHIMEEPFTKKSGMTYCYSSSSDESLHIIRDSTPPSKKSGGGKTPAIPTAPPPGALKLCPVTPPPPVIRRMCPSIPRSTCNTPRSSRNLDAENFIFPMPELASSFRRASSGSSLSTITAEKQNQTSVYASLQRSRKRPTGQDSESNKSVAFGGHHYTKNSSSSANASPLLDSARPRSACRNRNQAAAAHKSETVCNGRASVEMSNNIQNCQDDLREFAFQLRQLDVDISSLRQDVGSVQENIATVRETLEFTREKISRLASDVLNVERRIGAVVKETTAGRQLAQKLVDEAEAAKSTHEHLREEAKNLVDFLRQAASYISKNEKRLPFETDLDSGTELPKNGKDKNNHRRDSLADSLGDDNQDSSNEYDDNSEISLLVEN